MLIRPPGDFPLVVIKPHGKDQSISLDEISRLLISFLILDQYLTPLGHLKYQISAKNDILQSYTLISAKLCVTAILNLHQRVPRSIGNNIGCCCCILLPYLEHVVLLNRTASPSLTVIGTPVKIQTGSMTLIDLGIEEEAGYKRFWNNEPQIRIRDLRKSHLT